MISLIPFAAVMYAWRGCVSWYILDQNVTNQDDEFDAWALSLTERGLATPAILLLELLKPLSFLGSQLLIVADPLLEALVGNAGRRYARLLEDRRNVDRLLQALEARQSRHRFKGDG